MSLSNRGSAVTLELAGELDVAAEDEFQSQVSAAISADCDDLVVDLRALEFIDSMEAMSVWCWVWTGSSPASSRNTSRETSGPVWTWLM
jgi:hypothetical protein